MTVEGKSSHLVIFGILYPFYEQRPSFVSRFDWSSTFDFPTSYLQPLIILPVVPLSTITGDNDGSQLDNRLGSMRAHIFAKDIAYGGSHPAPSTLVLGGVEQRRQLRENLLHRCRQDGREVSRILLSKNKCFTPSLYPHNSAVCSYCIYHRQYDHAHNQNWNHAGRSSEHL